jgi:phosphoglycolate phosphatase
MFDNTLYPGIKELLKSLKASGKTVILATSKVEKYAREILEHFNLLEYFDFTSGAEADGRRSDKAEVILHALKQCGAAPEEAVMIGDRHHDINGAAKAGIESVGVLYGYGGEKELEAADHIVKDAGELLELLI